MRFQRALQGANGYDIVVFPYGLSGAVITVEYNQINTGLARVKNLRDKITNLK